MNLSCASAPKINDVVMMAAPGVTINPWNDDAFSMMTLTDEVNRNPVAPYQVSAMGWEEKGERTTTIAIDLSEGGLDIVDSAPYNGVPTELSLSDGETVALQIPSHPARSTLYAAEVANRRAPGTLDLETVEARKQEHYAKHNGAHALTYEVDRIGALLGLVSKRKGEGSVKYNLAEAFGKSPYKTEANFADPNFDPIGFFRAIVDLQGEKSNGAAIQAWDVLVDSTRMQQLSTNKFMRDIWKAFQQSLISDDLRTRGWQVTEGVFIKQYMNNFNVPGAQPARKIFGVPMIIVPRIAGNLQTRFAPRQDFEHVGEPGSPVYMEGVPRTRNEAIDFYSESNHVHFIRLPELVTVVTQTP